MEPTPRPLTKVSPARFFALTYILSWLIWAPLVASRFDILPRLDRAKPAGAGSARVSES